VIQEIPRMIDQGNPLALVNLLAIQEIPRMIDQGNPLAFV